MKGEGEKRCWWRDCWIFMEPWQSYSVKCMMVLSRVFGEYWPVHKLPDDLRKRSRLTLGTWTGWLFGWCCAGVFSYFVETGFMSFSCQKRVCHAQKIIGHTGLQWAYTCSTIIMEVKIGCSWMVTTIGVTHVWLSWIMGGTVSILMIFTHATARSRLHFSC